MPDPHWEREREMNRTGQEKKKTHRQTHRGNTHPFSHTDIQTQWCTWIWCVYWISQNFTVTRPIMYSFSIFFFSLFRALLFYFKATCFVLGFFTASLQCVFIQLASQWSPVLFLYFTLSISACLCTISVSFSFPVFLLRPFFITTTLFLSHWSHWGQAWCCGLVDKYHVRLFHVLSGRATVYLSSTVPQSSLAVHKVYLHF